MKETRTKIPEGVTEVRNAVTGKVNKMINETGYYHHTNGHGQEEVVYVEYDGFGGYFIYKHNGQNYPLIEDKGTFGDRIKLPNEDGE